ncbi:MAG: FixH family protein [Alphaproteobacteria bacterium]|jgi:hypothetical protein|nr:FixH family protein [Alphaproteobacteria bacterium]MBU1548770.1 FixH family protein [Alphaproteobacteria bacterium]MBU2335596.1 FixH family protein [Alphaproteobacteria bacterium]MBU2391009.1 FixH family protein [Alphaproteobacteria bacterium]|tara:strand:- start:231 stop:632 length:402 start_codon:yes stop_codon:yes gene_type:complete
MKAIIANAPALAAALTFAMPAVTAFAAADDYEFQLVEQAVRQGSEAIVTVRLVDRQTGALVGGAVIFATRLDMAPEDMEAMTTNIESLPSEKPGLYRFTTDLSMEGRWRFKLAAKVQGEEDTVQGELILQATP